MPYREKKIFLASTACRLLQGVFCVHKPADWGFTRIRHTLNLALCNELNSMKQRSTDTAVEIVGSLKDEKLEIVRSASYADNPLAVGPRYQPEDIRLGHISLPPYMSSGLCVLMLKPTQADILLKKYQLISTFELDCELGLSTEDGTVNGRVLERSRYYHVHQGLIERYLSSVQSSFQAKGFNYAGVDLHSQEAFELASKGLVRPAGKSTPIVYSLRCIDFKAPSFTIEVQTINENDEYLRTLVQDLATKLRTTAALVKMRRVRWGPFTLDQALVKNAWSLESVLQNIRDVRPSLDRLRYPNLLEAAEASKPNLAVVDRI